MKAEPSGRDKVVAVTTYIHTDDIDRLDSTQFEELVYVAGTDRCGWQFSGFLRCADLAPVLFP